MSKIEVDAIEPQSGTTLTIGASGDTIIVPAGTVSLPAITTTGDTNTGIFFPAADTIAFTEGGAEAMRITSAGNVGIGTSAPNKKLHVAGSVFIEDSSPEITFETTNSSHYNWQIAVQENVANALEISVGSADSDASNDTFSPVAVFKNSGEVGINTTTPDAKLSVNGVASFGDGTAAAPSVANFGDLNTGMFFPAADTIAFSEGGAEAMRIDSSGNVLVGTTDTSLYNNTSGSGWFAEPLGSQQTASDNRACADWNRMGNDGAILGIYQAGTEEGSISVSGSTVSYNGFTGTHWSRFTDNSTPTILRGTVLETLDEMCYWYNLEFDNKKIPHVLLDGQSDGDVITYNHEGTDVQATIVKEVDVKHMMSKVSDTTDAKNVYGLFIAYDLDGEGYNDFYVASVGSYVVRIKSGETIAKGDLLQSNGDGTAKVQSDDNIKSSSFAKVLSTTIIETYEDGSYLVPCSLMC
jgi:hypothetical protein